jgi:ribonuclease VapC
VSDRAGFVLDASAVLALLQQEPGATRVAEVLPDAWISAVTLSEVIAKLVDHGVPRGALVPALWQLGMRVHVFDGDSAIRTGDLGAPTRALGLSLGDRACLALAQALGAVAVTADRAWQGVAASLPGIVVELIR